MTTPSAEPPRPIEQWLPLYLQESEFAATIEEGEPSRVPKPTDLSAGDHALRCQQCQNVVVLQPCRYCGGTRFALRRTAYGQLALFCRSCTRAYDGTACSCGTVVPVSHKTLHKKVLIHPVPPGVVLRWTAIGLIGLIVLVLVFKALF